MHIEIHLFPDHFSISPDEWKREMLTLNDRIQKLIFDATINNSSYAMGKTTLLADDGSQMIVATLDIRRQ